MCSMVVDGNQATPKYQQVLAAVRDAIHAGDYEVGSQLPPERELSKILKVTPVTLRKALALLAQEGMIERVRGKGTFVIERNPVPAVVQSPAQTGSIARVLVETPSEHWADYVGYNNAEARVLDRHLSQHGYTLVMMYTDTRELTAGRVPLGLERRDVEGVILTGFVEDFHVNFIQNLGFPVVVIGNRPIYSPVSHVSVNCVRQSYLMTKALMEESDGRVVLVTRPFDCYFTFEVLAGYTQAIKEAGGCSEVVVLTYSGNDVQELRTALSNRTGNFGLLVNHTIPYEVRGVYQDFGWSFIDHPIAMVSETHTLSPAIARQMNVYNGDLDLHDAIAAELMAEILNGAGPKRVSVEPEMTVTREDGELRIHVTWKPVVIDHPHSADPRVAPIRLADTFMSDTL